MRENVVAEHGAPRNSDSGIPGWVRRGHPFRPRDTARASKYYTELVTVKYRSSEDADSIAVLNVGDRRNGDDR